MLGPLKNIRTMLMVLVQFFRKPFTVKYRKDRKEKIVTYDRSRGELILNLPECKRCGFCADACLNLAITMVDYPDDNQKPVPQLDLGACMFCGLCADACPFDVLQTGRVFYKSYLTPKDMIKTPDMMFKAWKEQKGTMKSEEELVE